MFARMHRILYISTARQPLSIEEQEGILAPSRRNNRRVDVTGLLVVGGRRFLQVLEGPEAAVRATYERIAGDPRHYALVILNDRPITERAFARWSMGFEKGGSAPDGANLEEQIEALIAPITDATLRAYFAGFAKSHSSQQ